jgi:hypothetical protein
MPMQQSFPIFLVDDDYKNFKPGKTRLKFRTVYAVRGVQDGLMILMVIVLFILGLAALTFAPLSQAQALANDGVITKGTIKSCEIQQHSKTHEDELWVRYTFEASAKVYASRDIIDADTYACDQFVAGAAAQVIYASTYPNNTQLILREDDADSRRGYIEHLKGVMNIYPVLLSVCGLIVLFILASVRRTWRQFDKTSVVLDGYVTSATNKSVKNGIERTIQFNFTPPKRKEQTGVHRSIHTGFPEPVLPLPDTLVKVLYVNKSTYLLL